MRCSFVQRMQADVRDGCHYKRVSRATELAASSTAPQRTHLDGCDSFDEAAAALLRHCAWSVDAFVNM